MDGDPPRASQGRTLQKPAVVPRRASTSVRLPPIRTPIVPREIVPPPEVTALPLRERPMSPRDTTPLTVNGMVLPRESISPIKIPEYITPSMVEDVFDPGDPPVPEPVLVPTSVPPVPAPTSVPPVPEPVPSPTSTPLPSPAPSSSVPEPAPAAPGSSSPSTPGSAPAQDQTAPEAPKKPEEIDFSKYTKQQRYNILAHFTEIFPRRASLLPHIRMPLIELCTDPDPEYLQLLYTLDQHYEKIYSSYRAVRRYQQWMIFFWIIVDIVIWYLFGIRIDYASLQCENLNVYNGLLEQMIGVGGSEERWHPLLEIAVISSINLVAIIALKLLVGKLHLPADQAMNLINPIVNNLVGGTPAAAATQQTLNNIRSAPDQSLRATDLGRTVTTAPPDGGPSPLQQNGASDMRNIANNVAPLLSGLSGFANLFQGAGQQAPAQVSRPQH